MRKWRRTKDGVFNHDDILTLEHDDKTPCPCMKRLVDGKVAVSETRYMEEINDMGRVIRSYKMGELINEGTIIGVDMDKDEAMKRLEAIEKETAELKKIIASPDELVFNEDKIYVTNRFEGYGPFFIHGRGNEAFYIAIGFTGSNGRWTFPTKTGQETIQYMIDSGYKVQEFSDQKAAISYMLSQCEE